MQYPELTRLALARITSLEQSIHSEDIEYIKAEIHFIIDLMEKEFLKDTAQHIVDQFRYYIALAYKNDQTNI